MCAGGGAGGVATAVGGGAAAVLFLLGRSRMREVSPKPERTIETLKEDAQWARHPTK
ncbi:phage holin family protein [Streptomyces fradiae]|uniref:phage holin family protein n=1 Tax=Streptomyces fradiae TaxID=1906 RepID=UPI003682DD43